MIGEPTFNPMRTVNISFNAARLPLEALTSVMAMISMLRDAAGESNGMIAVTEVMASDEALARLPKTRAKVSMPTPATADAAIQKTAATGRRTHQQQLQAEGPAVASMALTEGQQMLLDKMRSIGKAMNKAEVAECIPEKKGNVIGTWLHGLEQKGLVVSEPDGDTTVYRATPAMQDA